jgi:hypothetical protein
MTWLKRALVVLLAFCAGVLADAVAVAVWIERSFDCVPRPGDPCDGGPLIAFGLFLVTAPFAGLAFALVATLWLVLRARRARPPSPPADSATS